MARSGGYTKQQSGNGSKYSYDDEALDKLEELNDYDFVGQPANRGTTKAGSSEELDSQWVNGFVSQDNPFEPPTFGKVYSQGQI